MTTDSTPDLRVGDPVWLYGVWPTDRVHGWHLASVVRVSGPCWVVERADGSGLAVPRKGSTTRAVRTVAEGEQPLRAYLTREAVEERVRGLLCELLLPALARGVLSDSPISADTLRELAHLLRVELPPWPPGIDLP